MLFFERRGPNHGIRLWFYDGLTMIRVVIMGNSTVVTTTKKRSFLIVVITDLILVAAIVCLCIGLHHASVQSAQKAEETINTLHSQAVADLVNGDVTAAVKRYDATIAQKKGAQKAAYLSERASVLFDYEPDKAKTQILQDAYAAEKLNSNATNAYFIYTVETYYHHTTQANTYLKYYQDRLDKNVRTE